MDMLLITVAMAVRLIAPQFGVGFESDINCFKAWSSLLVDGGFANFYTSSLFTDYPPGYMYVLYGLGWVRRALGLSFNGAAFTLLIKMPAIFCDLIGVAFLYDLALKHLNKRAAFLIGLAYALNPAVILNSAVWGQVDAVYTLLILMSVNDLTEKKLLRAYALYAVALLIKPQALIFAPVYLFSAYHFLSQNQFQKPAVLALTRTCAVAAGILALGILPFTTRLDFTPVFRQYTNTLLSYPYATINAYNFYGLFGANWAPVSGKLLFLRFGVWGAVFIAVTVIISILLLYRNHTDYFLAAGLLNVFTFLFSTRMHERYIFPAIALLLAAYIHRAGGEAGRRRSRPLLLLAAGFSATLYVNCAEVLNMYANANDLSMLKNITPVSLINLGLALFMAYWALRRTEDCAASEDAEPYTFALTRTDILAMAAITLVYAAVAFTNLGDTTAPQTVWPAEDAASGTQEAVADFGANTQVTQVVYKNAAVHEQAFSLAWSEDGVFWQEELFNSGDVFAWREVPAVFSARYVRVVAASPELTLLELGFKNNGTVLPLTPRTPESAALFDEQHTIPDRPSYRNSTYFDEIYHARTAYEFVHGLPVYETTHPPLGKSMISWGISLFGMTPFGYRFMGTLIGVLMLPLLYLFAKRVCGATFWAVFATALFAADFMHFTQTRIATIDVFVTFFILAAFYCMYAYRAVGFDRPLRELLPPLAFSGLFMGLAVAVKWQGVYAGFGLAIVFFTDLYHRRKSPAFQDRLPQVIGSCVLFFVVVPLLVYLLAYIPYLRAPGSQGVWDSQLSMFRYHSQLKASHTFESPWWQWPLDIRPVFLYIGAAAVAGLREAISTMGNPVVWYAGLVAVIYALFHRSRETVFLLTAFAAQILPWLPVARCTFIYHYFPCVGFMLLLLAYTLSRGNRRRTAVAITAAALALFVVYYPVLSGMPTVPEFVHQYLEWLPTWQII